MSKYRTKLVAAGHLTIFNRRMSESWDEFIKLFPNFSSLILIALIYTKRSYDLKSHKSWYVFRSLQNVSKFLWNMYRVYRWNRYHQLHGNPGLLSNSSVKGCHTTVISDCSRWRVGRAEGGLMPATALISSFQTLLPRLKCNIASWRGKREVFDISKLFPRRISSSLPSPTETVGKSNRLWLSFRLLTIDRSFPPLINTSSSIFPIDLKITR